MHPDYQEDADAFLDGHQACFCNMFIMKKAIFFDYCEWLFPILEEFDKSADYSTYSKEALRTPGHLSERLLNIYLMHHRAHRFQLEIQGTTMRSFHEPGAGYAA